MVNLASFRKMALSLDNTEELPHFHLVSFRNRKKIFATYHEKGNRAMLKFSPVNQSVFCSHDPSVFYPVPGFWGKKGATFVELSTVKKDVFQSALYAAHEDAAPPLRRTVLKKKIK